VGDRLRRDLKISGTGSSAGGSFDEVHIRGEGAIHGDVECQVFKVMGNSNVAGNLQAKSVRVQGALEISGKLGADDVKVMGSLAVKGDCSAETFQVRGAFTIDGLLNAERVELSLYGPSNAAEIGCRAIRVKRRFRVFGGFRELVADTIEGDDIYLEDTVVKVVRGNRVHIGPRCQVDLVEYRERFEQSSGSKVTESRKV
jgi:cytoskeletal protein CcmA (bactofilin family)